MRFLGHISSKIKKAAIFGSSFKKTKLMSVGFTGVEMLRFTRSLSNACLFVD